MAIEVTIFGDKALEAALARLPDKLQEGLAQKAMKLAGQKLLVDVKAATPRKTGKLADTLKLKVFRKKGVVGVRVITGTRAELGIDPKSKHYYPAYVELGTQRDSADPFMRQTLRTDRGALEMMIANELRGLIQEAKTFG